MPPDLEQLFDDFRGDVEEMVAVFDPFVMGDNFEAIGEVVVEAILTEDVDALQYFNERVDEVAEELENGVPSGRDIGEPSTFQQQNADMIHEELYGFYRFSEYFQEFLGGEEYYFDEEDQQLLYAKLEANGVEYPNADDDIEELYSQIAARMYHGFKRAEEGRTKEAWRAIHFPSSDIGWLVRRLVDRYEHDESEYEGGTTEEPRDNYEDAIFRLRGLESASRTLHRVYNKKFGVPDNQGSPDRKEIIEAHDAVQEAVFEAMR